MIVLLFISMSTHAEAIEEKDMCWNGVCSGMTMPEVKKQLKSLGFKVHDNRLKRWLFRHLPKIGGVFTYQGYTEYISASSSTKCKDYKNTDKPCLSLNIGFVRFPTGRLRLYVLQCREIKSMQQPVLETIKEMKTLIGTPDDTSWVKEKSSQSRDGTQIYFEWAYWSGKWKIPKRWLDGISVKIHLIEDVNITDKILSPPDMVESVHTKLIDFTLKSHTYVGREAETAWRGEKANWSKDPRTGCSVWNNYPSKSDKVSWDGPCVEGYANGFGTVRWSKLGREYEVDKGEFRKGKLNGHAKIILNNVDTLFEGEFHNNLPHGQGTLKINDKVYSGNWAKGCFDENGERASFFTDRDKCNHY